MKLIRETDFYYIGVPEDNEVFPSIGLQTRYNIKTGGQEVWFPKPEYRDWEMCLQRVNHLCRVNKFDGKTRIVKTFEVMSKSVDISDEDWETMRQFMVNPDGFKKEDFRVYEAWLCHNFVDRDMERFSLEVLKSFQKTIVGKALLTGHNWNGTGEGRYFKARLERKSINEVVKLAGPHPNRDLAGQLQKIESADGGLYWLVAAYYMLADETDKIRKIDSGIISDMSIGFRAPKLEAVKSGDNDQVLWWEYRNSDSREAEALEGSHVFLGSQYGARTRKDAAETETVYLCANCFYRKISGSPVKVCPECGGPVLTTQISLDSVQDVNEKTAVGEKDNLREIVETAGQYRQTLVDEAIKFGCLANVIPADEKSVKERREFFGALSLQDLLDRIAEYRTIYKQRYPAREILQENIEIKTERTAPVNTPADRRYYRSPVIDNSII
ncbi:hypothetical protein JXQ31_04080 [candidate division KSB1 bacterium]|nr:hypothetical protein [candidate division KSB1 bacterium]